MMPTLVRALQEYQKELKFSSAEVRIGRAVQGIAKINLSENGLSVRLVWPSGTVPEFQLEFPADRLLKLLGGRYHPIMRRCRFIKESIQAALQHRGV